MSKKAFTGLLLSACLVLSGCGGGDSSSDGGGGSEEPTVPQNIAGSYQGTFEGSGNNQTGTFTCEGTFNLNVSQAGSTITVAFSVIGTSFSGSGTGKCPEAFNFSGSGTYDAGNGNVELLSVIGDITAAVNGQASALGGTITLSGNWSITETNSKAVVSSGTWTAVSQ